MRVEYKIQVADLFCIDTFSAVCFRYLRSNNRPSDSHSKQNSHIQWKNPNFRVSSYFLLYLAPAGDSNPAEPIIILRGNH